MTSTTLIQTEQLQLSVTIEDAPNGHGRVVLASQGAQGDYIYDAFLQKSGKISWSLRTKPQTEGEWIELLEARALKAGCEYDD